MGARRNIRVDRTALAVTAIVGGSFILRLVISRFSVGPWVVPDELIYAEMAKSIADGDEPAIRGVATRSFGLLYSFVIAPAWAVTVSQQAAYSIALAINAFVMSLAAIPAFLLARRFLTVTVSLVVAVFSVLLPSLAYTMVLMTENLFYPVCLFLILAVTRALERPTVGRQLTVVSLVVLAFAVRQQAVVLLVAYFCSIGLYSLFGGHDYLARLRPFKPSVVIAGATLGVGVIYGVATTGGALGALGTYAAAPGGVDTNELPVWIAYHLADLTLYLGAIPVAASAVVVWVAATRRTRRLELYSAVTVPFVLVATLTAAGVSSQVGVSGHDVLSERNMFFVAPLLLIGLALWIDEGFPRPRRIALATAGVLLVLVMLLPISQLAVNAHFQALGIVPWIVLPFDPWLIRTLSVILCCALLGLWLRCPTSRPDRLWAAVGVTLVVAGTLVVAAMASSSRQGLRLGVSSNTEWIDNAVPGAEVVVLWRGTSGSLAKQEHGDPRVVWLNEFFNRSVGPVFSLGVSLPYGFPETRVTTDADGAVRLPNGERLRAEYVLALCDLGVRGRVVAIDKHTAARVSAVNGIVRTGGTRSCSP